MLHGSTLLAVLSTAALNTLTRRARHILTQRSAAFRYTLRSGTPFQNPAPDHSKLQALSAKGIDSEKSALHLCFLLFMIGFILSPRGGFVNRPQMEISRHSKNRAFIADSAAEFCFSRRKLPRGNTIILTVSPVRGKIRGMVYQYANPYIVLRIFVIKGKCFRAYRS